MPRCSCGRYRRLGLGQHRRSRPRPLQTLDYATRSWASRRIRDFGSVVENGFKNACVRSDLVVDPRRTNTQTEGRYIPRCSCGGYRRLGIGQHRRVDRCDARGTHRVFTFSVLTHPRNATRSWASRRIRGGLLHPF
jgi:hypothetical protein